AQLCDGESPDGRRHHRRRVEPQQDLLVGDGPPPPDDRAAAAGRRRGSRRQRVARRVPLRLVGSDLRRHQRGAAQRHRRARARTPAERMMRFAFDDDAMAFRAAVRDLLDKECGPPQVRAAWESDTGFSSDRWRKLADMGVVGITVPEDHGGLGLDEVGLVLLLEEAGRAALPEPLIETSAVAAPLLAALAPDCLTGLADGDTVWSVGLAAAPAVSAAPAADRLVVEREGALHVVARDKARLSMVQSVDHGRRLASVDF